MDRKALIKALRDTVQSASNTVASGVSAPVDLIAAGLRKVGLPIPQAPVGGSQWMENMGLTVPVEDGIPKMAGETLGMIVPMVATAKAPQIAAAANRGLENLAAPRTLNTPGYGGQRGAIVWHGSPHKFDAFDASKIGTGEGAQAYGHGLYFAESPDVAKSYQQALSNNLDARKLDDVRYAWNRSGVEIDAYPSRNNEIILSRIVVDKSKRNQGLGTAAMQDLIQYADDTGKTIKLSPSTDFGGTSVNRLKDFYKRLGFVENKGKNKDFTISESMYKRPEASGALYKVDLPDEAIARMLDWDKPLSQQAPGVQKALLQTGDKTIARMIKEKPVSVNNGEYWSYLGNTYNSKAEALADSTPFQLTMGRTSIAETPAEVSKRLQATGIPGIRYLDQGSRGAGAGTSNFVVFPGEEKLLRILERNGQPMGLMGAPKQRGSVGFVYPQQEALDIAQRNAAKPVSEGGLGLPPNNTPMDRARAMGFNEIGYTGTARDFISYDPTKAAGAGSGSREGPLGAWLTDDPRVASTFAEWSSRGQGGNVVYPMMIRGNKPYEVPAYSAIEDVLDANTKFSRPPYRMVQDKIDYESAKKALAEKGDYVALRNTKTDSLDKPITQFLVTDPTRVRSRFAAFDPARINENNMLGRADPRLLGLLGLGTAGGIGAYNYMQGK